MAEESKRAEKWRIIFTERIPEIDIEKWIWLWRTLEDYFGYPLSARFRQGNIIEI